MAKLLRGDEVTAALNVDMKKKAERLVERSIRPCLAILRVGEREDDIAYENSLVLRAEKAGVHVRSVVLGKDVSKERFLENIHVLNEDKNVHGILMFRPLPAHLDEEKARNLIIPEKDIDGCTDASLAGVFTGRDIGFPPCTAEAVMEMLRFYDIDLKGKKVCVMGRSLVIGRPVAMMLMQKNATVVNCHTATENPSAIARCADILIAATGNLRSIGREYTTKDQVVIDVGVNFDYDTGNIAGDVDFDKVEPYVKAITPVPGGTGTVTTSVLINHVIEACIRQNPK